MYEMAVVALVGELADTDPAACDRDGLASLVALSQRVRAWLDAFDIRVAVHAARLAEQGSCEPASSLLTDGGRRSVREADAAARRASVCAQLPAVHDALASGRMSAGHVDAVARLAGDLDDAARAELHDLQSAVVRSASVMPVETFEREMSKLGRVLSRDDGISQLARLKQQRCVRRWVDRVSGMCHTHLQVDPETDARIATALDAAVASARAAAQGYDVDFDHLKADALVGLITGARTTGHRVPDVTLLTDARTMRDGPHEDTVCETGDGQPLPVETLRRLGCDATITPITLDDDGVPLTMGRTRRLATPEQRRALRTMYRSCGFPGCGVRFEDCRVHHVTWWEHLGATNLDNLLPLCERHHHHVHEGGWTLTLKPDRTITLRRPDGTLHHEGPHHHDDDSHRPTTTTVRTARTLDPGRASDGTAAKTARRIFLPRCPPPASCRAPAWPPVEAGSTCAAFATCCRCVSGTTTTTTNPEPRPHQPPPHDDSSADGGLGEMDV